MIENLTDKLPEILAHFGIQGSLGEVFEGPLITDVQFKLSEGSKFSYVEKLIKDIARELGVSGIRVSQIANSTYISFEIPQPKAQTVPFGPITQTEEFISSSYALPICVGVNMHGKPVMKDLSKMPHLLVAGTTGSGKSVGLNSFILSLINKKTPEELQFVLIDPKRIEFSMYNNQKYMLQPVITDMSEANACLRWLCTEMNERYTKFEKNMVRNIGEYHAKGKPMSYIVCVIDEFADLMMFDKTVEKQVQMLAQKSRAAGIHLLIATQRPSVDVITGTVKANLPTRLSYKVSSPADSMTILNTAGAEDLLGRGDSLLLEENGTLTRILGTYVSDEDIMNTLEAFRCKTTPKSYDKEVTAYSEQSPAKETSAASKEKPKKGFWSRIGDFWDRLGVRVQKRIINFLITCGMAVFGYKTAKKSSTSTSSTKKLVRKSVVKALTKKKR
ncbi:MAG: hypothetical protein J6039_04390 [Alphaproteobacteria bacterium]|nr:hypothetical protein [Alphaproteobacteria bacterium]